MTPSQRAQEANLETRKLTVEEVISPSTFRGHDGQTYVLRGVADTEEENSRVRQARAFVEDWLLNAELYVDEETVQELPDEPALMVDVYNGSQLLLNAPIAAHVGGIFAGHPMAAARPD